MSRRGFAEWRDELGRVTRETDVIACVHCRKQVFTHDAVGAKRDQNAVGSFCSSCSGPTCADPKCNAVGGCTPFEQRLENHERAAVTRRQLFAAMGLET